MNKEEYLQLANVIDRELEAITQGYSREERKWKLGEEDMPKEQVKTVQASIRTLKHQKILVREAYLIEDRNTPPILIRMLKPLITRRKWSSGTFEHSSDVANSIQVKQSLRKDGAQFFFPERDKDAYRNKHLKGFWTCSGCMVRRELPPGIKPEDMEFYKDALWSDYQKQIQWCPNFIAALVTTGKGKDPQEYVDFIRAINPEAPICYGGLLHCEFQVTEVEAKLIKFCDTCNYTVSETKELAQPIDPETFEVSVALGTKEGIPEAVVTCTCNVCGELIFEAAPKDVIENNEMAPKYKRMMDQHYNEKHPEVKE